MLIADRVQKLKDARSEAAKEIEAYKAKKDEEFKKFESEVSVRLSTKKQSIAVSIQLRSFTDLHRLEPTHW